MNAEESAMDLYGFVKEFIQVGWLSKVITIVFILAATAVISHLFARVFYGIEKDIAKLADILGHSSINTTRIYIISTGTEHRRRMENMRLII